MGRISRALQDSMCAETAAGALADLVARRSARIVPWINNMSDLIDDNAAVVASRSAQMVLCSSQAFFFIDSMSALVARNSSQIVLSFSANFWWTTFNCLTISTARGERGNFGRAGGTSAGAAGGTSAGMATQLVLIRMDTAGGTSEIATA